MNVSPLQRSIQAAELPLERLVGTSHVPESEKVKEVCRQFEAVLLRQILQQARKTSVKSEFETDSTATSIYDDLVTQQLAESISRSGSFGLAKSLEAQLTRQVLPPAQTEAEAASSSSSKPLQPAPHGGGLLNAHAGSHLSGAKARNVHD